MPSMSNEEVVRAYVEAMTVRDSDRLKELRHVDWQTDWPQSGERVRGDANMRLIEANFPGGMPSLHADRVVGSEDRWVTTPAYTVQRIVGSGDTWWAEGTITYGGGSTWCFVAFMELRDGKIHRQTEYFAEPFEVPAWRAPFVEIIESRG